MKSRKQNDKLSFIHIGLRKIINCHPHYRKSETRRLKGNASLRRKLIHCEMDDALATQECGSVVNNTLTSPGYPNSYPNNLFCNYSVPIPHGMAMKIYFHDFDVEHHPSCIYDYLEISNENGEAFGVFCGWRNETLIIEIGGQARLTFHSDSEVQGKGFNLSFAAVPIPEKIKCGSIVNNTLSSPGHPANYQPNMDCYYSVRIPYGMALKITFYEFDVEFDQYCRYDYLEIINDEGMSFGKYCGEINNKEINVTGMLAQLQFHSDSDTQKGGFLLLFSFVPLPEKIKCGSIVNNTLTSPGYPDKYLNNMDCNYSVPIPHGMALKITFDEFDVEFDRNCEYDYFRTTNERKDQISKFCGRRSGKEVVVTGNYALLKFHSDYITEARGFRLFLTFLCKLKQNAVSNILDRKRVRQT
ncbi:hypothetical protein ACROYT_G033552 [Oculina patagonica]